MDSIKRIRDILGALAWARHLERHEHWSRAELEGYQQGQLNRLARHAASHTSFYRELYKDVDLSGDIALGSLPITDKKLLLDNFEASVTDDRLSLDGVKRHIEEMEGDAYLHGEYRAIASTGTSGLRGYFLYDRVAWRIVLANTLRWQRMLGITPRLPNRVRIANIGADAPIHVTARIPMSSNVGLFKLRHFDATAPIDRIAQGLQEFQPHVLLSYPTIATLLAEQQQEGRLSISPRVISTHSEMLTKEMRGRMRQAWGLEAFDHYGTTEEPHVGAECSRHEGLHVFEDTTLMEIVDENNRPVPDGTPGAKWLLTNLYNRVQPIIRYELTDILTRKPGHCSCGRPFALVGSIGGRSEDVLWLPRADGTGAVPIAPLAIGVTLVNLSELWEFTARHGREKVIVTAVPRKGADPDVLRSRVEDALARLIRESGAIVPPIEVTIADSLQRRPEDMGKLRMVGRQKRNPEGGP